MSPHQRREGIFIASHDEAPEQFAIRQTICLRGG
jgi:hypothetical protein